jgi:hypothetical protein
MKNFFKFKFVRGMEVLTIMMLFTCLVAQAQSNTNDDSQSSSSSQTSVQRRAQHLRRHDLILGICAGQKLATASTPLILPIPTKGQAPTPLDDATKAAIKSALDSCYQEMTGTSSSSDSSSSGSTN